MNYSLLIALGIRNARRRRQARAQDARIAALESQVRYQYPVRIQYPLPPVPPRRVRQWRPDASVYVITFILAAVILALGILGFPSL